MHSYIKQFLEVFSSSFFGLARIGAQPDDLAYALGLLFFVFAVVRLGGVLIASALE